MCEKPGFFWELWESHGGLAAQSFPTQQSTGKSGRYSQKNPIFGGFLGSQARGPGLPCRELIHGRKRNKTRNSNHFRAPAQEFLRSHLGSPPLPAVIQPWEEIFVNKLRVMQEKNPKNFLKRALEFPVFPSPAPARVCTSQVWGNPALSGVQGFKPRLKIPLFFIFPIKTVAKTPPRCLGGGGDG